MHIFALAISNVWFSCLFFPWHKNENDSDIPFFTDTQLPLIFVLFLSSAKTQIGHYKILKVFKLSFSAGNQAAKLSLNLLDCASQRNVPNCLAAMDIIKDSLLPLDNSLKVSVCRVSKTKTNPSTGPA